jgi:DNA-directed RNA polymerase specialized sigma24 family protein
MKTGWALFETCSNATAALADLPVEQRRAIELGSFEGLTQTEIVIKTESPPGTVKERVKVAMSKRPELLRSAEEQYGL